MNTPDPARLFCPTCKRGPLFSWERTPGGHCLACGRSAKTQAERTNQMHTEPMPESAGTFRPPDKKLHDCPHCQQRECVTVKVWESSCGGYEDEKNECGKCGKVWWVEGADA